MSCFKYFFTSSLFLIGQLSSFEMCAVILNRYRYDLVFPWAVTVYVVRYPISELCKSKDAGDDVAELPSWHKLIIQRRILAAILKDDPGVRREGRRSARHDISRTGVVLTLSYSVTI